MDQPLPLSQSALAQSLVEEESDCSENSKASDLSSVFLSEGDDFNFEEEEEDDEDKPSRAQHNFEEEKEENDQTSRVQPSILPWREVFKFKQNWLNDTDAKMGPTNFNLNAKSAPIEFFSLIFDDNMFLDIMKWTNQRAADKIDNLKRRKTRMAKWKNMTLSEMKAFFAALYLMGITRLPYRDMHWEGRTTLFSAQGVKSLFSRRRFHDIYGSICLRDPTTIEPGNKLYKIEPFVLSIITNSQFYYRPHQDLSIDESMIAFTGRVGFKVYEPRKPIKRGLKAYVLCDAHTGYVLNWKLYTGRSKETVDDIVKKLVEGLENEGYRIFMDSYYTSVKLFQDLKDLNFGCCGTAVGDRLHMSKQISTNITAGLGDHKIQYYQLESDPSILLNCWKDHKLVYVLSNYHSIRQVNVERTLRRRDRTEETKRECLNCKETLSIPEAIADYNAHMGGVDRFDQLASYYIPSLNARRWYLKVMFHLCEMAMINSYILYKSTYEAAKTKCLRHLHYRKEVIRGLTRELRQSRFLLLSPEKRIKCKSKIDHIDTICTAPSQDLYLDLDLETSLQLLPSLSSLLESTEATATTQDTGTMQSLESSITNNQNDFIIKRRQARNNQYTKTEFPQNIDNGHYTRSKGNIKLNFEIDTDIQRPLTRQGSVGQFQDNPCLLQKMTMSSLHAGNQRKACAICKWKTIIQEEKEGIEWLKGKVQWQKKEPPKRKRFHKTLFWCETCEVPVCVSPCYDIHLQQRLKRVKLSDNY